MGDITSPRSIVTILHEIGHVFDYRNIDSKGVEKLVTDHRHSRLAETLRKERSASAFAIKAIKPYLVHLGIKTDIINFLKYYALESYYDFVKSEVGHEKRMDSWARSEYGSEGSWSWEISESEQRVSDFSEWKKTAAYQKWKNMDQFRNIVDKFGEEYAAWSNWVDDTNYDHRKDIF